MAERVIRVGIAGQGRSGFDIHAHWLRESPEKYRIVAVADLLPERRSQAIRELGCRAYKTWEQLAADEEVELFVNSTPSNLHPKAAIGALRAGRNVVCEKPLATKVKDFDAMVAAARKARRVLAPFQNSRFYPFFAKMQEVISSGVLGRIIHVRIVCSGFSRRWDWQTRQELWGGNLNNTGPHPMDHAVMLFGPKMPKVFSRLASEAGSFGDADDFALVTLYGPGSPVVEVEVSSYRGYPVADGYVVNGQRGSLAGGPGGLRWKYYSPAKAPKHKLMTGWSDDRKYCGEQLPWREETWTPPETKHTGFQFASQGFYDNVYKVLTGGAQLVVKPEQVRRQIAVLEACHRQNPLPNRAKKFAKVK
jgi:predicted dehydrogenase